MRIEKFNNFNNWLSINEEKSLRLPNTDEQYWLDKGKTGKNVALYFHDDMDGIFTSILMKKWLTENKFNIVKYGVVNYNESWKNTSLDPKLINIALDFANMPGDERDEHIDWYLDHHGTFKPEQEEKYKDSPVQKFHTASAYAALLTVLNAHGGSSVTQDKLISEPIDMIDAAKYGAESQESPEIIKIEKGKDQPKTKKNPDRTKIKIGDRSRYEVSWQRLLNFDISDIAKSKNKRLEFAAAFNQLLKRGDHKTLISVVKNVQEPSIFAIYNAMKAIHPVHNKGKDFTEERKGTLREMERRTRGTHNKGPKLTINSFEDLLKLQNSSGFMNVGVTTGYIKIGDIVFVPTGTWANALRIRAIVEKDLLDGQLDSSPKFILLQYGGTLQVCGYESMELMKSNNVLPLDKDGNYIDDLGKYMTGLLTNFQKFFGYYNPDTSIGQDEITVSGGHGGIGSISNIFGKVETKKYEENENGETIQLDSAETKIRKNFENARYIDAIKNKIVIDLSGLKSLKSNEKEMLKLKWSEPKEYTGKEPEMDNKVINADDVTNLDKYGKPITKNESRIASFKNFKRG